MNGGNGRKPRDWKVAPTLPASAQAQPKSRPPQGELTMSEVVSRLRVWLAIVRSRWVAGLGVALLLAGGLGYALIVQKDPEHTAVTTMLAQSDLDELLNSTYISRESQKTAQENFLQNHLSVMRSRRFSVALAGEFSEEERDFIMAPYLQPGETASDAAFEGMLATRMTADRQRDREFFILTFRHEDPDLAVMVADRMTATYLELVQREIKEANLAAAEALRTQAQQLQEEIGALEDDQRDFRKEKNIISLQENQGLLAERLRLIDQNRANARIERVRLETLLKDAEADVTAESLPFDNPLLSNFANNQELRQELDRLQAEREVMALRYGPNHPKMRDLEGRIGGVRENLSKNFELAFADLKNQYRSTLAVEEQLESEFQKEFNKGIEMGRLASQFLLLGGEVDAKRVALSDLLRRVSEATLVSKLPADVMRVIDPAYIAAPRLAKRTILGGLIGLMSAGAFLCVPLVLHAFDQRIKGATDVERELEQSLLGGVPRLTGIRPTDRPHVVWTNSAPAKVEPFMAIIAQIELTSSQDGAKSFVVTSSAAGEGKSTIASNLAAAFAQLGRRTLLVDGDLRRPCQHQLHRIEGDRGLLRWAEAGFPRHDLFGVDSPLGIVEVPGGFDLLATGGIVPQPAQLLVSAHVDHLLAELAAHYDIMLVDTPPAGLFPDALVLAQSCGETLLVARESKAPVVQIRRVIADIDKTTAPVLGVILNDFSSNSLNPRLAYSGAYESYSYLMDKRQREKAGSRKSALVSK